MVFDPKLLRRKGKDRHVFLFEQALLFCKETKDTDGKVKYLFKHKLKVLLSFMVFQRCFSIQIEQNIKQKCDLYSARTQTVPLERTHRELSFEWSHL